MSFALIVGMAIVAFLYLTINLAFFTVLSPAEILKTSAVAKVSNDKMFFIRDFYFFTYTYIYDFFIFVFFPNKNKFRYNF
jgi:hypothetical protein